MWSTAAIEHACDRQGNHLGRRHIWLLPGGWADRTTLITIPPTMFHTANRRFTLSASSGLLDVVQAALWPPQGPGEGGPGPPSVQRGPHASGPAHGGTPARGPQPERPPVAPSYEELFPEYASLDRVPPYPVRVPDR